jgi:hypothetical protein
MISTSGPQLILPLVTSLGCFQQVQNGHWHRSGERTNQSTGQYHLGNADIVLSCGSDGYLEALVARVILKCILLSREASL